MSDRNRVDRRSRIIGSGLLGYGQSGLGRDLGEYALDNYMEVKTVIVPMDILGAK